MNIGWSDLCERVESALLEKIDKKGISEEVIFEPRSEPCHNLRENIPGRGVESGTCSGC